MANLARSKSLLDVLVSIELKLVSLGWLEIQRIGDTRQVKVLEPRLIGWAVVCCKQSLSSELVDSLVSSRSLEHRWWILRQMLPENALLTLDSKLDSFLEGRNHRIVKDRD